MIAARIATTTAFLALILPVAALVFAKDTWAASGNVQVCNPGANCTIGEFLYNDSYSFITTATCNITSRFPNGTLFLNNVNMPVSSQGDGWYAHSFTTPSTLGLYRTEVKCTTGSETLALDKSFEVQTPPVTTVPSANDVASAVWGYSNRSLSTFGTLISDIWNNTTRSLTTISNVTNVTNIENNTKDIRNQLAKLTNKPTVEVSLENKTTGKVSTNDTLNDGFASKLLDPQNKINQSIEIANKMLVNSNYLKSKARLMADKWTGLGEDKLQKSIKDLIATQNSIDGQINWVKEEWSLPITVQLQLQNKKIIASLNSANNEVLRTGKTKTASLKLQIVRSDIDKFLKLVGKNSDTSQNTLFGQLKKQADLLSALDKNYLELNKFLTDMDKTESKMVLVTQVNVLNKEVVSLNQLPNLEKTLLAQAKTNSDQKQLKNKALTLRGVIDANKLFLAQGPNKPLSNLWLEEGSMVFKILVTNPSAIINQTLPVKYYLPPEIKKESVTDLDKGLTVNYDPEKNQYFVSGEFELAPSETQTLQVVADDGVFHIPDLEIASIRKQAEELSRPLKNTAYFAQGTLLKTDIDTSLDKIDSLQKNGITPEAKIRSYREAQIEYKAAKVKLEKLKELATAVGSAGTLFGFVGGAQVLAVWGLIIIMVAGFVFLALYMRTLRESGKYSTLEQKLPPIVDNFENYEEVQNEERPIPHPPKRRFPFNRPVKYMTIMLVSILIGGSSIYALVTLRQGQIKHQIAQTPPQAKAEVAQAVLGSSDTNSTPDSYKEVNILVPDESTVTIHAQPSINSPVLISLNASKKAKEITRQDIWVKVILQNPEGKEIAGWVDGDFVEEMEKQKPQPQGEILAGPKMVIISDTPTGFLRVRKTPGGEEITKINPGEQYQMIKEQIGWVQIVLEDGTSGWVSKQYITF